MATPGRVYNSSLPESIEVDELYSNDARIIADQLAKRAAKEKLFTRLGNRCIVSVKPSRGLAIFSDSYSKDYALKARELNEQPLPPHVFTISTSAYFHALRAQIDQSIVLLGDSNSGKSSVYRVLVRNLCDLSKTSKKKSRVQSNILKVDSVFSAFGNATTSFNQDASCFAQYTEIQFDQTGKMVGAKFIEYLLEKSRASKATDGGKSFHVFYFLLEGATHEERMKLHLSDPAHFSYLNGSHMVGFAQGKGSAPLDLLRENLKSLGIGRRHQEQLWTLLSAILHLGNIQFNEAQSDRYACSIKNFPQLQMVADMLGITATALQTVLTTRSRMVLTILT
jgi:chitin synthase